MNTVVLSLGSNVGERLSNLSAAINMLEELPCRLLKKSSVYETAAWGNTNQPNFYNMVIEVQTDLEAFSMMDAALAIEKKMGRIRKQKWEPRIIDIDILFFNEEKIESGKLTIPHPHLHERRFVLEPLHEILPGKNHPVLNKTTSQLMAELRDDMRVEKLKTIPHQ